MSYRAGIDDGTNSVRGIAAGWATGAKIAGAVVNYPSGKQGPIFDPKDHNLVRQNPED